MCDDSISSKSQKTTLQKPNSKQEKSLFMLPVIVVLETLQI